MNIATKKEAHKQTYMDYVSDAKVEQQNYNEKALGRDANTACWP